MLENLKHQIIVLFASIAIALGIATVGFLEVDPQVTTKIASAGVIMLAIAFITEIAVPKRRQSTLMDEHLGTLQGESKFQDIVEQAPDPIMMLDAKGYLNFMNATAETVFGFKKKELIGKHFAELGIFSEDSLSGVMKEFALLLSGNPSNSYYADFVKKDGEIFGAQVDHKPIIIGGKFDGVEIIVHYYGTKKK